MNAELQESTPVKLSRAGYSQNTILRLHPSFAGLEYETGVTSFLDCLAEDLADLKVIACCRSELSLLLGQRVPDAQRWPQNWQQA